MDNNSLEYKRLETIIEILDILLINIKNLNFCEN